MHAHTHTKSENLKQGLQYLKYKQVAHKMWWEVNFNKQVSKMYRTMFSTTKKSRFPQGNVPKDIATDATDLFFCRHSKADDVLSKKK